MLPELGEARRLVAAADHAGALRQLERASDVVRAVPAPGLQIVANGALAQVLRTMGRLSQEADVWSRVVSSDSVRSADDPMMLLHAYGGATTAALHGGDEAVAANWCGEAEALCAAHGGHSDVSHFSSAFAVHRSLVSALGSSPGAALPILQDVLGAEAECDAAVSDGARLLLGDALTAAGRGSEASAAWVDVRDRVPLAPAAGAMDAHDGDASPSAAAAMRAVSACVRLGRLRISGGEMESGEEELKAGIALCERFLPADHPLLAHTVAELGRAFAAKGEPVTAEALFRSATDAMLAPPDPSRPAASPRSVAHAQLLLPAAESFAQMLEALEWNGKLRTAEADRLREQARCVRAACPQQLAGRPAAHGVGVWLGLEPWYGATFDVDFLALCAAPDEAKA